MFIMLFSVADSSCQLMGASLSSQFSGGTFNGDISPEGNMELYKFISFNERNCCISLILNYYKQHLTNIISTSHI